MQTMLVKTKCKLRIMPVKTIGARMETVFSGRGKPISVKRVSPEGCPEALPFPGCLHRY
jgi:hypothetical protein